MKTKIIQKEKERQEKIFKIISSKEKLTEVNVGRFCAMMNKKFCHKQSLINLKEYLEELRASPGDIKELKVMIGRYCVKLI